MSDKYVKSTPVAQSVPFDNEGNGFTSDNTQDAIVESRDYAQQVASPGFTWGRSGNVPNNTYLLNDSVPSNTTGRIVPFSGYVEKVFVANENPNTFTIAIQKRSGASFVNLCTISLTSERTKVATFTSAVAISALDELAVQVISGSCKNVVIGVIIKGNQ